MTQTGTARFSGDVRGAAVRTIGRAIDEVCGYFEERTHAHLAEHGLDDAAAQAWYDIGDYAAVYEDLLESTGEHTVHRIGKELAFTVNWDEVADVTDALASLDEAYAQLHRGNVGGYEFEQTGAESGRLVCKTPYPAAAERGFLRGVGQQFTDTGFVKAEVADERRDGDLYVTTLDVEWWESTDIGTDEQPTVDADSARGYAGAD